MRVAIVLTVALLLCVTGVVAQTQKDPAAAVIGRWEGQRPAEGRVDNVALVIDRTSKGLTGQAFLNKELFDTMTNIVVAGDKMAFSLNNTDFTAVIQGKAMTLTAHFEGRDLWTMTLEKKDKGPMPRAGSDTAPARSQAGRFKFVGDSAIEPRGAAGQRLGRR